MKPNTWKPSNDHAIRIHQAIKFIEDNLDEELSLEVVSDIAHTSPYHFHRIFKVVTGETLNTYITRKRIEKTASVLLRKPDVSVSELSLQYGFKSNSSFTRAFKKFYGISPRLFRKSSPGKYSKISQVKSKNGQEQPLFERYICSMDNLNNWIEMNAKIEVKELKQLNVAYINQIGVAGLGSAFDKLMKWARPIGLLEKPSSKMITVYHDSLKITDHDKARMSVCITLDEPTEVQGEISLMSIPQGRHIIGSFEIGVHEFEKAWTSMFVWMNEQGYKKSSADPFEIYHNNFNEHPEKICIVDFYVPIASSGFSIP